VTNLSRLDSVRIAYAFDTARDAVLILGGDKTGDPRFYEWFVPKADKLWEHYLAEREAEKRQK
jgi:hypothetical protein